MRVALLLVAIAAAAAALPPVVSRNAGSLQFLHQWAGAPDLLGLTMPVGHAFLEQDRLYEQARQVFCADRGDGSESLTAACAALLVWRVPWSDRLATAISERSGTPDRIAFGYALAELYQRRTEDDRARAAYTRLLDEASAIDEIRLRLGLLADMRAARSSDPARWRVEAEGWYREYLSRVPTDILSLERLIALCAQQPCRDAPALEAERKALTDDGQIAARLLGTTIEALTFAGPSSTVARWEFIWLQDGLPGDARPDQFFGSHDALELRRSAEVLRIDGLRARSENPNRVGGAFVTTLTDLQPETPLLLTFLYKGLGCRRYDMSFSSTLIEEGTVSLPDTAGAWWKAALVIWPGQTSTQLRLTNQGDCQGWFADVRTRVLRTDHLIDRDRLPTRLGRRALAAVSGLGWTRGWWSAGGTAQ